MRTRKQIGSAGETMAAEYLLQKGYEIIVRNWRCRTGELDIVAGQDDMLVIVEVRTRRKIGRYGLAKESVNARKQIQVRETAQFYVHRYKLYDHKIRFDVISIDMDADEKKLQLEHIQGAF
jgi:putative endonuclease